MAKPTFDAAGFLAQDGLELARVDDSGYHFATPDGQEVNLDVTGYLKSKGVPVEELELEFNTPDSPLDQSPVSLGDRAKLALGNTKGQLKYLKTKFDNVAFDESSGLVVKDKGVWQKVDKSGMDPWELTKDIVEGAVSFVPSAAAATAGAAKGMAAGAAFGPAGVIAGGVAGAGTGGAAAEGIRTSLGRMVGTYDATPEEQLADVGVEFLLNAGGQAIVPGAKLALPQLVKAAKTIGKAAHPASKNILATALGRTTGAGEVATATLLEAPEAVVARIAKHTASGAGPDAAVAALKGESIATVDNMLKEAPRALSQKFGQLKDLLVENVDESLEVSIGDLVRGSQNQLAQAGLGKWVATSGGKAPKFELLSPKDFARRVQGGQSAQALDDTTRAALEQVNKVFNQYADIGKLKGKQAASAMMEVKKAINATSRDILDSNPPPTVTKFVNDFRASFSQGVGEAFHKAGPKSFNAYKATAQIYDKYGDAVSLARRLAKSENGSETLLTRLYQGAGMNQTYKDLAGDMVELLGKRGEEYMSTIKLNQAAAAFAPWAPKTTLAQLGTTAAAAYAATEADAPGNKAAFAVGGLALMSPRIVAKQVQYAMKGLDWMKKLPPSTRVQWLQNPDAVRETFKVISEPALSEDDETQQLLQQVGVR